MKELLELLQLLPLLKVSDSRERRRNLRAFKKGRRRLYRNYKKDGFTTQEKEDLKRLDNAYVEMLLELGKF